jgi:hypothetical protein
MDIFAMVVKFTFPMGQNVNINIHYNTTTHNTSHGLWVICIDKAILIHNKKTLIIDKTMKGFVNH